MSALKIFGSDPSEPVCSISLLCLLVNGSFIPFSPHQHFSVPSPQNGGQSRLRRKYMVALFVARRPQPEMLKWLSMFCSSMFRELVFHGQSQEGSRCSLCPNGGIITMRLKKEKKKKNRSELNWLQMFLGLELASLYKQAGANMAVEVAWLALVVASVMMMSFPNAA